MLPSFFLTNIRSIKNKIDDLRASVSTYNPHFVLICESWLNPEFTNDLIHLPNYVIFRHDRLYKPGGGVCVFSSCFTCEQIKFSSTPSSLEILFIFCKTYNMFIVCMYIPPSLSVETKSIISNFLISSFDELLLREPSAYLCIGGDFNDFDFTNIALQFNLMDFVINPTRGANTLDHLFMNKHLSYYYPSSCTVGPPIASSDHSTIVIFPIRNPPPYCSNLKIPVCHYDLRQSFMLSFLDKLSKQDWSSVYNPNLSINVKCHNFHHIIQSHVFSSFPMRVVTYSQKDKPWITTYIKSLINDRWHAFRTRNFPLYNNLKVKIKSEITKAKKTWANRITNRSIWDVVKFFKGSKSTDPMYSFYSTFTDIFTASNTINDKLSTVFNSESTYTLNTNSFTNHNNILPTGVDTALIHQFLSILNPKKAPGHDRIPTVLYKKGADLLAEPLTHLIALSIERKEVPHLWKCADVIVLPKSMPTCIDNLRPISLLSVPAKILEKVILHYSKDSFLSKYDTHQFGFRAKSSTACALIFLHDYITRHLDDSKFKAVAMITYDFQKAFDKLNHDILLKRMCELEMPHDLILWTSNYLQQRFQRVRIASEKGTLLPIRSGVPQGSLLGPYLFCIFVSSLVSKYDSNNVIVKFADDSALICPISSTNSNTPQLQDEHQNVLSWATANKLPLNLNKCSIIYFHNQPTVETTDIPEIARKYSIKYLGFMVTSDLKWHSHIDYIIKRASKTIYVLRVMKPFCTKTDLINVYNATARSVLEYAAPVLIGLDQNNERRLHKLQSRIHKIICGPSCHLPCLTDLSQRRVQQSIKLFQKALHPTHILHTIMPPVLRSTRTNKVNVPYCRTSKRSNSFVPKTSLLYNSL